MLLTYLGLYTENDNKYEKWWMSVEHKTNYTEEIKFDFYFYVKKF